jgi:DNA-binding response OmpR family regulator
MISARTDEIDRLVGLETGADDYLTKPFSPRELQARVTAMFRRPRTTVDPSEHPRGNGSADGPRQPHRIRHGRLVVDTETRTTFVDDHEVELTRTEFDLLSILIGAPRRVWPRPVLIEAVWGGGWANEEHLVEVHVGNLRRKLTRAATAGPATFIRTVRGVGYRLEDPHPL